MIGITNIVIPQKRSATIHIILLSIRSINTPINGLINMLGMTMTIINMPTEEGLFVIERSNQVSAIKYIPFPMEEINEPIKKLK
jgi:hypothetical protein